MNQRRAITWPRFALASRRSRPILAALAILLVSAAVIGARAPLVTRALGLSTNGVATPADVAALMARPAGTWIGQVVLVQGTMVPSTAWTCAYVAACQLRPAAFVVPAAGGGVTRLPVAWGGQDPLWALLRRLPGAGALVPQRQEPHWGTPAIYRVQLEAWPDPSCGACVVAVVLDADPPD